MPDNNRNIEVIDKRPFFEKTLCFGIENRILDQEKCRSIIHDGAKGTVQVATYFGSSHLHTDLENARQRIVNLVSLYLEHTYNDNLLKAAQSLRDNTFLFHSRNGNEMLKTLYTMPDSTILGDMKGQSLKEFQDEHTLTKPFSSHTYRKEYLIRENIAITIATACWFAKNLALAQSALDFIEAETIIRTAILVRIGGGNVFPNRITFAKLIDTIRTKRIANKKLKIPKKILDDVPSEYQGIAEKIRGEIAKYDALLLSDSSIELDALLNRIESRYFVQEGSIEDISDFDALVSKAWHKTTQGKEDPYSRLTVFLCIASGVKPKTTISDTEAKTMIRQIRQHGFDSNAVSLFIQNSAPFEIKDNLLSLWQDEFLPDAQEYLVDDSDPQCTRAMKFLQENCNIKCKKTGKKK